MVLLWCAVYVVLTILALTTLVKICSLVTVGKCRSTRDMSGKTVIITGGNRGIGKETARELCRRNARVILACRDIHKARAAADEIAGDTGVRPECMNLDLCSFHSIRQFAQQVLRQEERLDVLINNAGILATSRRRETEDGFEVTFQSNYLGHFLLTNLLLGLLKKSSPCRIINVGSIGHWMGTFNSDVDFKKYSQNHVYTSTKLYMTLFTMELARRLAGTGVTANCLHPGFVKSDFAHQATDFYTRTVDFVIRLFGKSVNDGAQTSVHLAVSEEVEGVSGGMFSDCKPSFAPGKPQDAEVLWNISQRMAGLC
ncbi:hypothetical protein HPB49_004339 [Dermacentor silvarum]|uniref:Uncharacterized protein n=1 Tax=Dermacentor silvarum TaxID=543639 RepID=A0ACB8CPU6_DERSI|nr:retinol dehydrogenase 13 [Dermacentor silvarum]KAH7949042.1 hypothetical protein HPB49_004339 [Dermacentor silvarum]